MIGLEMVFRVIAVILGLHSIYSAVTMYVTRDKFDEGGILDWQVTRLTYNYFPSWLRSIVDPFIIHYSYVLLVKMALGGLLIAAALLDAFVLLAAGAGLLFLVHVIDILRLFAGMSGAYHMQMMVSTGLFLGLVAPAGSLLELAAVAFICAHGILGYFVSGISKLPGPLWLGGQAVLRILGTRMWGHPYFYNKLKNYPRFAMVLTWGVMLFEVTFPLVLFVDTPLMLLILGGGLFMHLSIAVTMGINQFLLSFGATYPAIIYINSLLPNVI